MKTIKFRVRNPLTWLSPLICVVYLIGVVVLVVQNHTDIYAITGGSGALLILLLSPALAPLFLLLWLLDPVRQVRMGEGRFVLTQGNDVLGEITYPEIAHMTSHRLESLPRRVRLCKRQQDSHRTRSVLAQRQEHYLHDRHHRFHRT